jgi:hypothetical protein
VEIKQMTNGTNPNSKKSWLFSTKSFRLTSFGVALSMLLQTFLVYDAAYAATPDAEAAHIKQIVTSTRPNEGMAAELLNAANPARVMEQNDPEMTEEAMQREQAAQRLRNKIAIDRSAAAANFGHTINKLPILATATVGIAVGHGGTLQEGLNNLTQKNLEDAAKKPVLAIVAEAGGEDVNERISLAPPESEVIKDKKDFLSQLPQGADDVDGLTRQTIQKLIEFERLNTYFRVETTRQSKYRKWRTFITDEALNAGLAAFTLIYVCETLRTLHRGIVFNTRIRVNSTKLPVFGIVKDFYTTGNFFKLPPNHALEAAFYGTIPFISVAILQETFELGENFYDDWKAHKRGLAPSQTIVKAVSLRDEIDGLIAKREAAAKGHVGAGQETELISLEGKLLRDMRDLTLDEYGRYYAAARRARPAQDAYYIPEIAQRSVALAAAITGASAQQRLEQTSFGAFGILQVVGAILQPASPIAALITNKIQEKRSQKALVPVLVGQQIHSVDEFDADRKKFEDAALAAPSLGVYGSRIGVYKMARDNAAASIALSHREEAAAKKLFATALTLKTFAFFMLTAYGVISMTNYGKFTNLRHIEQIGFSAALMLEILTAFGFVYGLVSEPIQEAKIKKAAAAGILPGQVLEHRINNLDKMENSVTGKVVSPTQ